MNCYTEEAGGSLKAYSLISYRGHSYSQTLQSLNLLYLFLALP